uniref:tRNA N(3)-methylcytidine methyltransferase METTL6 isoform X4 n=1 Tax=Geotrypetes seraphini TaxID=260995 RepID=A0A6P8QF66_GEOSA|nr:tRNA N(3)-methylcytidine methyltransferase METTL6 isoform X4 [Geotrypetes seraphini]
MLLNGLFGESKMQPEENSVNSAPRPVLLPREMSENLLTANSVSPTYSDLLLQRRVSPARTLTAEEAARLEKDQTVVSHFKQVKLEKEAQKNWDLFFKRNSTNFFKDRHWTTREFEELGACREFEDQNLTILEAGCGVGNCLFPLLEEDTNIFAYACDFSPRAIEFVKVLKPGGRVLFRDYGLYDHTMLRFKSGNKLGENFYVRQDGTRSYFFTEVMQASEEALQLETEFWRHSDRLWKIHTCHVCFQMPCFLMLPLCIMVRNKDRGGMPHTFSQIGTILVCKIAENISSTCLVCK